MVRLLSLTNGLSIRHADDGVLYSAETKGFHVAYHTSSRAGWVGTNMMSLVPKTISHRATMTAREGTIEHLPYTR